MKEFVLFPLIIFFRIVITLALLIGNLSVLVATTSTAVLIKLRG